MARADHFTLERKKTVLYSDFPNTFDINPFTTDLARITNEDSIKQSLRNLVLTDAGERFFDSNKGGNIKHQLFELIDPDQQIITKVNLSRMLAEYEPRIKVEEIRMSDALDSNELNITLIFSIINIPNQTYDLTFSVVRIR